MKTYIAAIALMLSGLLMAQSIVTEINVQQIMQRPWIALGSDGAKDLSYQINHSIHYGPGATPQNRNVDVILRIATRGPYGKVTHTGLVFFTLFCFPDGTMANQIDVKGIHEYPSDISGAPNAPADNSFYVGASNDMESVDAGSPPSLIGKSICAKR